MTAQVHERLVIDGEAQSMAYCPPLPVSRVYYFPSFILSFILSYYVCLNTGSYLISILAMIIAFIIGCFILRRKGHPRVKAYRPESEELENPRLVFLTTGFNGRKVSLDKDEFTFGRSEDNDIVINHGTVSSHHGKFRKIDDSYEVFDIMSQNGTRVNGEKVSKKLLEDDDVLAVGGVEILYEEVVHEFMISTACWRGYVGSWEIKNDKFYLTGLSGEYQLIGEEPLLADWFTGVIRVPQGEMLRYVHMGFGSVYEEELHIKIVKGKVVKRRKIDNRNKKHDEHSLGLKNLPGFENKFEGDKDL